MFLKILNSEIAIDVVYMLLYTKHNLNKIFLILYLIVRSNIRSSIHRQH